MIRLTKILKEGILSDVLTFALVNGAIWAISQVIRSFRNKSEYKKFESEPHIKWLDRLGVNENFNKFVYHTIKNDKKLKEFDSKLSKATNGGAKTNIQTAKYKYEKEIVKKWLDSDIAQKELDKVFEEIYPDLTKDSDIPGNGVKFTWTFPQWKSIITKNATKEWADVLNDGTTKKFINQFAKKQGLELI
jgi:hypothetical protein